MSSRKEYSLLRFKEWQCFGMEISRSPGFHSSVWNWWCLHKAIRLRTQSVHCYAGGKGNGWNSRIYGPWNIEALWKMGMQYYDILCHFDRVQCSIIIAPLRLNYQSVPCIEVNLHNLWLNQIVCCWLCRILHACIVLMLYLSWLGLHYSDWHLLFCNVYVRANHSSCSWCWPWRSTERRETFTQKRGEIKWLWIHHVVKLMWIIIVLICIDR